MCVLPIYVLISIHSPHTRRDVGCRDYVYMHLSFNPLSSYEKRLWLIMYLIAIHRFQSTLLIREETRYHIGSNVHYGISIHSPHTRRDGSQSKRNKRIDYFNPLSSYEKRRSVDINRLPPLPISIHSPHTRRDLRELEKQIKFQISIHSPHTRRDHWCA